MGVLSYQHILRKCVLRILKLQEIYKSLKQIVKLHLNIGKFEKILRKFRKLQEINNNIKENFEFLY